MTKFTAEQLEYLEEFIEFTDDGFNVKGSVEGNVKGDVEGSVWGSVKGSVLGNVKGNVWGYVEGSVLGDVEGSVWGSVGFVKEKPLRTEGAREKPCREAMSDMMITIDLKTFEEMSDKIIDMEDAIKQLFALLDITEETDDGRTFHPNTVRSCRAMDAVKLDQVLCKLKKWV